ncbi:hypothetical protein C8Q75DRAFT_773696 [Abortiporus biennis]|nr:hypothetical protein C8Q75DRAFT_773696 [Abortiporus biennis]
MFRGMLVTPILFSTSIMPRKLPLTIFILLQIFNIPAVAGALRNVSISINNPAVDFSSGWHVRHSRTLEGDFAFTHEADDVRILLPERTVSLHYYGLQTHHHSTFIACLDCEPFRPDLARAKLVNTRGSSYGYDLQQDNLFSMRSLDPEQIHTLTIVNLCDSRYDDECILVFDHLVVTVQEDDSEQLEDDTEEEFGATLSPRDSPNIQVTMAISAAAPSQISIVTQTSIKTVTVTQTAASTTPSSVSPIPTSTLHTSSSASGSSSVAPSKTESHSQSSASPIKTASSTSHVNTQSGSSTTRTSSTSISATPHTHSSTTSVSSQTSSSISSHTSKTTPRTSSNSHSTITTHPPTSSAIASPTLLPNTSSAADNNATIALGHNTLAVLIAILVFVATLSVLLGIIVFSPRIRAWLKWLQDLQCLIGTLTLLRILDQEIHLPYFLPQNDR